MSSVENQFEATTKDEEEGYSSAMQLVVASVMPMVMESAIELDVFGIIAKAGEGARLSPHEIASRLPTQNPQAPVILDSMLRFLASHSVLTCSTQACGDGGVERFYGLAPASKYFVPNEDGVSLGPVLRWINWGKTNSRHLKDIVLESGDPFERVHGKLFYDYLEENPLLLELFNLVMFETTTIIIKKILNIYNGFENLKEVIDVGGGVGTFSMMLLTKYPNIKCINFDLPHLVNNLESYPGVTHIGGDMLSSIPKGENIIIKSVLHCMSDAQCLEIMKNCYEALPDHGKLILVELLFAMEVGTDNETKFTAALEVSLKTHFPHGKQRAFEDFKNIAKEAGFIRFGKVCYAWHHGVMEFYKTS